jgi:hypothetical protein
MATKIHVFSTSFTLAGSASPGEVAINQSTGEVYAASFGSGVVDAFEASGTPDPTHPKLTEANGTTPYPFINPFGLAVDNSAGPNKGDIYVADYSAQTLTQFEPSGARTATPAITAANVPAEGTAQSGGLPPVLNNGGFNAAGVAVASDGDVYVADLSNNVIDLFEPNGTFVFQFGSGHISGAYAMTVGSSGDLYVANGNGTIEFEPSGACLNSCSPTDPEGNIYADEGGRVSEFNSSIEALYSFGEGVLSFGRGMALNDTSGAIYIADEGAGKVDVYKSIPVATLTIRPFTSSGPPSGTLTAEVDPAAAGNVTGCQFEYGPEKANYSLGTVPCLSPSPADAEIGTPTNPIESLTEVHADLTGLATLTTYHYRLVATDASGTIESPDHEFTLLPDFPAVSGTYSSGETPTSATLAAEINPGFGTAVYRFQYGTTRSYGLSTLISSVGSDGTDHLVTSDISGLTPATTYHYRAVAINYVGTAQGPDQTFTTPDQPAVSGASASNVTSGTATLAAEVNPKLATTTYHFQYGTDASYGSSTPESPSIGADDVSHSVSANLAGLAPATTYHFRIVATNPFGATDGLDQTFTTTAAPPVNISQPKPCRKGFVKKHGRCVKKSRPKAKHRKHGGKR